MYKSAVMRAITKGLREKKWRNPKECDDEAGSVCRGTKENMLKRQ
jgi:hypothetical protein